MHNVLQSSYTQLLRTTGGADALPADQTFATLQPDNAELRKTGDRVFDCTQTAQLNLAIDSAGTATLVPYWLAETAAGSLGWFRDEAQKITLTAAGRPLSTLQVKGAKLLLWVEAKSAGALVVHAAKLRTV